MTDTVQLVLPRHSSNYGINWGGKRRVLIAVRPNPYAGKGVDPDTMLFIVEGHSAAHGARGFGRDYHPAHLVLLTRDRQSRRDNKTLAEGRITKAVIAEHAETIDKWFGREVAKDINLKATLWLEREDQA